MHDFDTDLSNGLILVDQRLLHLLDHDLNRIELVFRLLLVLHKARVQLAGDLTQQFQPLEQVVVRVDRLDVVVPLLNDQQSQVPLEVHVTVHRQHLHVSVVTCYLEFLIDVLIQDEGNNFFWVFEFIIVTVGAEQLVQFDIL